ncbi:Fructokinase [Candidatus Rhodobacter oscarellae]|uniref:Fructokinase n=1 Tax=Candidatus Rhodobacter oscarellae TaxID=1675527 RepID=A0A0J9GYB9_9RHOB|nr:carbohydrate kinase [Candidatus Rhodobacter lobularis]KMW58473.1 Fructokinase [Candidatus Rhodobacter lobularis]
MILCCGEALIDMLPRETKADEPAFMPYPGGAVFNTAIALGRLGAPSSFVCGLSNDFFGEMLVETLQAAKVRTDLSIRSERPTTLAFVRLVEGQATYLFYDENTAMRMVTPQDMPKVPADADALVFGCISLISEPCAAAYEALMKSGAEAGKVIMIDPNIRPSFITDEAGFRGRINRMIGMSDIVKLSDEDLAWLGGPDEMEAYAAQLIEAGASLVCVTEGARGARGITKDLNVFVDAEPVEVVDTVGAGDTFNAGLLASLKRANLLTKNAVACLSEQELRDALTLGARAAAVTVSRAGANPPWAHEL